MGWLVKVQWCFDIFRKPSDPLIKSEPVKPEEGEEKGDEGEEDKSDDKSDGGDDKAEGNIIRLACLYLGS